MANSKSKTYDICDKVTGKALSTNISRKSVKVVEAALIDIGYSTIVKETAAGGSTGAGSIAVNMSGASSNGKSLKDFMNAFNAKITNKFKPSRFKLSITEDFDMESVFSRLSSMEKAGSSKKTEGTTFGIEDDEGNMMKVTVRSDQAQDFEQEIATHLADIKMNVMGNPSPRGGATDVSIAELLFKLKDRFDIIDVDFPTIPTDLVYNANKASKADATSTGAPMGDEFGDEMEDSGSVNDALDLTDFEEPVEGEEGMEGEGGEGEMDMGDLENAESVEEFPEETETGMPDEGSILNQVISMLKAQAEAETEKAKATAEQARADQARYTAQASQNAMRDQEESLRYDVEMEEQKKRQKEADKMADMAKHKISKVMGVREGDEMATVATVQRKISAAKGMYAVGPNDDPETRQYKAQQRQELMRQLNSEMREARNRERYEAVQRKKEAGQQQNQQRFPPQNPQQMNQQNQQQNQQQSQSQNREYQQNNQYRQQLNPVRNNGV